MLEELNDTEKFPVSLAEAVIVSEGVTVSLGDMLREEDGLLTTDGVAEDDSVTLTEADRKSTRLNSSHRNTSRMPSSA